MKGKLPHNTKGVWVDGNFYVSIREASECTGYDRRTITRNLDRWNRCDMRIHFAGETFGTYKEMARYYQCSEGRAIDMVKSGAKTEEEYIQMCNQIRSSAQKTRNEKYGSPRSKETIAVLQCGKKEVFPSQVACARNFDVNEKTIKKHKEKYGYVKVSELYAASKTS